MPYFISPLCFQAQIEQICFLLSTQFGRFVICPFQSVLMCVSLSLSFQVPFSSPFCCICHGNAKEEKKRKNLGCSNSFCALSVEKKGQFCFSSLVSVCWGLEVMKTIFHLHGVIWPGVAEQVCYGKINIMEGLTLLSLSHWDQCVCY